MSRRVVYTRCMRHAFLYRNMMNMNQTDTEPGIIQTALRESMGIVEHGTLLLDIQDTERNVSGWAFTLYGTPNRSADEKTAADKLAKAAELLTDARKILWSINA